MNPILKIATIIFLFSVISLTGCSDDNSTNPNTPTTGEVLLAEVSGDSVGVSSGLSSRSSTITSGTLNFTDRDSARISFYYTGENNNVTIPITIYYMNDTINVYLFNNAITPTGSEQFINATVPSPGVNSTFKYKISTSSSPGFSYFKFRDLKIYKK